MWRFYVTPDWLTPLTDIRKVQVLKEYEERRWEFG